MAARGSMHELRGWGWGAGSSLWTEIRGMSSNRKGWSMLEVGRLGGPRRAGRNILVARRQREGEIQVPALKFTVSRVGRPLKYTGIYTISGLLQAGPCAGAQGRHLIQVEEGRGVQEGEEGKNL